MTIQQLNYESACKALQAAGIDFLEIDTQGYKVKFQLSKDGVSAPVILDCDSAHIEEETANAIKCIERLVEWKRIENAKSISKTQKKAKRG